MYKNICFDIVGYCNAKCVYCHSGINAIEKNKNAISPEDFRKSIKWLIDKKIAGQNTLFSLFVWGEPFLHPQIGDIIGIMNEFGLRFSLSTNASVVGAIDAEFVKNLHSLTFSMSGFGADSYSKMHGFDIEKIKSNILKIANLIRTHSTNPKLYINFHVYKHNTGELEAAKKFCDENNMALRPTFGIINHWWRMESFFDKTINKAELDMLKKDLFMLEDRHMDRYLAQSKKEGCWQYGFLVLDEKSNILTCCQTPKDHPNYSIGSLFEYDSYDSVKNKIISQDICIKCKTSGMAGYINTALEYSDKKLQEEIDAL